MATSLNNLVLLYYAQRRCTEAEPFFERSLQSLSRQFQYGSAYMSEKDRLAFLGTVSFVFPHYVSFCLSYRQQDPSVSGRMYDVLLWEKGAICASAAALRARILGSGDPEAIALFEKGVSLLIKNTT